MKCLESNYSAINKKKYGLSIDGLKRAMANWQFSLIWGFQKVDFRLEAKLANLEI